MPRPIPTVVCHFTHIDNLPSIVGNGLRPDSEVTVGSALQQEAGEPRIKAARRRRQVTIEPGGVVADYVPFYFKSRSPMMYSLSKGNVPSFGGDTHDLAYLLTDVETLLAAGLTVRFTDRNAKLAVAKFSTSIDDLNTLIDWAVMDAKFWSNTDEDPDRVERRMAECLVHGGVPWSAITRVAVFDSDRARRVQTILDSLGGEQPPVAVVPSAYF